MPASVMVVEDMAIFREPIAAALESAGFNVHQATNGREALALIESNPIDLLLLDVAMPEMDGLTMLGRLRKMNQGSQLKVILLTAAKDRETVLKAAALGVRDYMLKSAFSLKELVSRAKQYTEKSGNPPDDKSVGSAAEPAAHVPSQNSSVAIAQETPKRSPSNSDRLTLLTRDQTRDRLAQVVETRTCAGVVSQVMALANSPNSEIADLVRVIETDPILASRVLQLANSPMFRQKYSRLANVEEAVRKVGMRAIFNAVISIGVFQSFPPDAADGFNSLRCWQHCFAVAAILRAILVHKSEEEREHCALIGLCHDLGEIVLRQHFSAEYKQILEYASQTGQSVASVETSALSMRHGEMVNDLLTRIGLPANVAIPIMKFHEGGASPSESAQTVRQLQLANWIAHGMMLVGSLDAPVSPISKADIKRAIGSDQLDLDTAALRSEVLTTTNMLARLPMADEARFVSAPLSRSSTRVWYARHSSYADLDPLKSALDLIACVRTEIRLPQNEEEFNGTDLILAVSPFMESMPVVTKDLRDLQKRVGYCGQPIVIIVGNAAGAVKIPNVSLTSSPLTLKSLAGFLRHPNRKDE